MIRKLGLIGAIGALALAVTGCDDGDSAPSAALSGTAAVGAPIVNTTVTIKCAGATGDITVTTDDAGVYSVSKALMEENSAALPCALRVTSGGVTLFSLVTEGNRANISPLTDLIVARAIVASGAAANAAAWFTAGASFTSVTQAQIDSAVAAVETALRTATGETDVPFDIFTTRFKADAKSVYDVWLESLKAKLTTGGANYATAYNALVLAYAGGGSLPTFVIIEPVSGGGGSGTCVATGTQGGTLTVSGTIKSSIAGVPNQTYGPFSQSFSGAAPCPADIKNVFLQTYEGLPAGVSITTKTITQTATNHTYDMTFKYSSVLTYTIRYAYVMNAAAM